MDELKNKELEEVEFVIDDGTAEGGESSARKSSSGATARVAALLAAVALIGGGAGFCGAFLAGRANKNANTPGGPISTVVNGIHAGVPVNAPTLEELQQDVSLPQTEGVEYMSDGSYMYTRDLVAAVSDSIVYIIVYEYSDTYGKEIPRYAGSGTLISSDGYIITNAHLVDDHEKFTVQVNTTDREAGTVTQTTYDAKVCGSDRDSDLAVLKIEAKGLHAAVLGDSDKLSLGDDVVAIGNPQGLQTTVTKGIVSGLNREVSDSARGLTSVQTDTAINSGNSGGALFNMRGEVVGIVNMKFIADNSENLGFAITINEAKNVVEDLITLGYVSGRAVIGIVYNDMTGYRGEYYNVTPGYHIREINQDMPVAESSLAVGDIIVKIEGRSVEEYDVSYILAEKSPGDTITVTVVRKDALGREKEMDIEVVLGEYKGQ